MTSNALEELLPYYRRELTYLREMGAAFAEEVMFNWTDDLDAARSNAFQAAQRALAVDQHDAWSHAVLGFVATLLGQNDTGIRASHRALDLNPNLAFAEGALGVAYGHQGDPHKAVTHHERATRLSPRDPALPWWNLARCWAAFISHDYSQVVEWATKITEAAPEFYPAWRHLAASNALLDRMEEARGAVRHLLRVGPEYNIRWFRKTVPISQGEVLDRYMEALRKAGLPE